ncbi:glycosyltransferase [Acinetobacter johnsonii]|uniref:glycosyltransferase n=1 Tax=Acinetobacter johnsonii TaxID=40214 RepID=UPI002166D82E|nr:glycosyltransferase [Acinetobacter johnsonii]MCS3525539.1 GT2 family glycosyltransferase [Acinetobacter johnsonii]
MSNEIARRIHTIVVTFNRKILLAACLKKLLAQSADFEYLIVVNNASTDGTEDYIREVGLLDYKKIIWLNLLENIGGAGGFSAGMQYAFEHGADYVWMMDDDAMPHPKALAELIKHTTPQHIYASLAVQDQQISWEMTVKQENHWIATHNPTDITENIEVRSLPFLGFMIHRQLVEKIGLPDTSFFIAADDTEYCLRAKQAGYKLYLVGKSLIEHPKAQYQQYQILNKKINYVSLLPWKRYYDTRNRIFIAKQYFGFRLFSQTLPSLLFRLLISLVVEKNRYQQFKAYFWGMYDGFLSNGGKKHEQRGLR